MGKRKRAKTKVKGASAAPDAMRGPSAADVPIGPGVVAELEEFAESSAGKSKRWRNIGEHPLTLAYRRGKISQALFAAGDAYRVCWEMLASSGRDSTQMDAAARCRPEMSVIQQMAGRQLAKARKRLSKNDRAICDAFCGNGFSMVESVRRANVRCHANATLARVQEALLELSKTGIHHFFEHEAA